MSDTLSTYRAKRDFHQTEEPSGRVPVKASNRLRFVIQKHDATRLHYDLRLELDGVFKSWAVTKGPSLDPHDKRLAVEVEDHPLDYGDFEGTIPKGQYGGGTVMLWDRGFWEPEGKGSPQDALKKGDFKFTLHGRRLHGSFVLVRMRGDRDGGKRTNWLLIKHHDDYSVEENGDAILEQNVTSIASGRTMDQIADGKGRKPKPFMMANADLKSDAVWDSKNGLAADERRKKIGAAEKAPADLPDFVAPQLCKTLARPPAGKNWLHEIKLAIGFRCEWPRELSCSRRERVSTGRPDIPRLPRRRLDFLIASSTAKSVRLTKTALRTLPHSRLPCQREILAIWSTLLLTCCLMGRRICARCHWSDARTVCALC